MEDYGTRKKDLYGKGRNNLSVGFTSIRYYFITIVSGGYYDLFLYDFYVFGKLSLDSTFLDLFFLLFLLTFSNSPYLYSLLESTANTVDPNITLISK